MTSRRLTVLIMMIITFFASQSLCFENESPVKNVIFIIGDGMGPQQIGLLNLYVKYAPHSLYQIKNRVSALEKAMKIGTIGLVYHNSADALVTDSAASSSQMASGSYSGPEMIGANQFGNSVVTIVERAERNGKSTGLVSDTRITHATPAGFAAHQPRRSFENEIAADMLSNDVDVLFSGGLRSWIPQAANNKDSSEFKKLKQMTDGKLYLKSNRKDDRNLLEEARVKGYHLAFTKQQMEKASGNKLIGLFSYSSMPDGIEEYNQQDNPLRTIPTLEEMTIKAIEILSNNRNGFFLMVEAGQIDWACHNNDAGDLLYEMIRIDKTIEYVLDWIATHGDTLLIITADHETAGFSFAYGRNNIPEEKSLEGDLFKNTKLKPYFNYGQYDILDRIFNQKKSYFTMFGMFDHLPHDQRTPGKLVEIINENTDFPITIQDAQVILEREQNEYYIQGHKYIGMKTFPKINDFKEFYVYGNALRQNILARIVSKQQMTVWSSGTHSHTPVPIVAIGPTDLCQSFSGLLHTTEWANIVLKAFVPTLQ